MPFPLSPSAISLTAIGLIYLNAPFRFSGDRQHMNLRNEAFPGKQAPETDLLSHAEEAL
jgi:hypothetical protein